MGCNITMPAFEAIKKPFELRDFDAEELQFISDSKSQFTANKVDAAVVGNGDAPDTGPIDYAEPTTPPPEGPGWAALERILTGTLNEAKGGAWKETGNNPKIIACFAAGGNKATNDRTTPWCAGFMSKMLLEAGIESLRSLSSQAYRKYGTEIGVTDWARVRKNDIIIVSYGGGTGHVGFFRGYDQARNKVMILGGNQSDNVTLAPFGTSMISSIKRNWSVPAEYDKPLYVNATGQEVSYKQTR